jgi:hypothetical protein
MISTTVEEILHLQGKSPPNSYSEWTTYKVQKQEMLKPTFTTIFKSFLVNWILDSLETSKIC